MWRLENILSYKSLSFILRFFNCYIVVLFEISVLKEVCYIHKNITNNTKIPKFSFPKFIILLFNLILNTLSHCGSTENKNKNVTESVGPSAGKFNIVTNDLGRTQNFNFLIPFLGRCGTKIKILNECQLLLKFGSLTNWNMQNSMDVHFCCFPLEIPSFLSNLVQKFKIVSLIWNLTLVLTRICKMLWWWSLFLFSVYK